MSRRKAPKSPSREVEKAFSTKIIEVMEALQILRDAIEKVREGRWYYLSVLSGQMRSLLIDKSGGSERRLLYIAEKLNMPLRVFCMRGVDDSSFPLDIKPLFRVSGFPITAERQLPGQMELSFDKLLDQPFILYNDIRYTARTVIEWFANKAGGSHYSSSLPRHFAEMLTFKVGDLPMLRQMLLQFAEATLEAGVKLLRAAIEYELHMVIVIPKLPKQEVFLLDAQYPGSPMRISLMLNPLGTPVAHLVGVDGAWIKLTGNKLVAWEHPRHLHLSVSLADNIHTRAELYLDGESLGSVEMAAPLFVITEVWQDFDCFQNKSTDGPLQDFSFGLAEFVLVGGRHSASDRANMLLYEERIRKDPDLQLIFYMPNSFGRAGPGERDFKMEGAVKQVQVRDILPNTSCQADARP